MSEKKEKRYRRKLRKHYKLQYAEFLNLVESLEFWDRWKVCWAIMRKLGTAERQRRIKLIKDRQKKRKK